VSNASRIRATCARVCSAVAIIFLDKVQSDLTVLNRQ